MQNVESGQLKARIDSGKSRDKVPYPDLAAAPLGTDDEAAGATPQGSITEAAGDAPTHISLGKPESEEDHRAPARSLPTGNTWWVIFGGIAVLLILIATASWALSRG